MYFYMTGEHATLEDALKRGLAIAADKQENQASESINVQKESNESDLTNAHPIYRSIDELPSVLGVKELHLFLGISRAGAYQLLHRADFPTLHIASRLLVPKDKLLEWIEQNINRVDRRYGW